MSLNASDKVVKVRFLNFLLSLVMCFVSRVISILILTLIASLLNDDFLISDFDVSEVTVNVIAAFSCFVAAYRYDLWIDYEYDCGDDDDLHQMIFSLANEIFAVYLAVNCDVFAVMSCDPAKISALLISPGSVCVVIDFVFWMPPLLQLPI